MMWNVAAVVDPSIERPLFRALSASNEMANQWPELGLLDVEETSLLIRMEYSGFDNYWLPLTSEGRWHNLSLAYLLRPVRRWPSISRPICLMAHVPSQRRMGLSWDCAE